MALGTERLRGEQDVGGQLAFLGGPVAIRAGHVLVRQVRKGAALHPAFGHVRRVDVRGARAVARRDRVAFGTLGEELSITGPGEPRRRVFLWISLEENAVFQL